MIPDSDDFRSQAVFAPYRCQFSWQTREHDESRYVACELKRRRWLGIELGPVDEIVHRFKRINEDREYLERIRQGYNHLFLPRVAAERRKRGLWTADSVRKVSSQEIPAQFQLEMSERK